MTRGQQLRGQHIELSHMEGAHVNRRGLHPLFSHLWVLNHIIKILIDFSASFEIFWPLLEDLELFFRPDLGGKLGFCFQLQDYINQRLLVALREVQKRINDEEL